MSRLILVAAMVFALPAWSETEQVSESASEVPRPVFSQIVGADALQGNTFVGVVSARNEVALGFPISGTLAERLVDVGALVSKDDVLARLDPKDLQAELRSAEAGVLVAETNLSTAQEAATRATELAERGVDSATRQEDSQRALVAAQAGLEQAKANLASAKDKLDLSELRAPQDGVITETILDAGAKVSPGLEVLSLASVDAREVLVDVSEQGLADLNIGMRFDVALIANPSLTTTATLVRIEPVAESTTRTRRTHLVLTDPPAGFRLGALVRLSAVGDETAVVSLPLSAVLGDADNAAVWVVDRTSNTVSKRAVVLGARFGDRVRITSGVALGDEVVLRGIHSLQEGQIIGRSVSK